MNGYFQLELQHFRKNKYEDLFLIKSDDYETIECNDGQLINLLIQILTWQEIWHKEFLKECVPHEDPEDIEEATKEQSEILSAIDRLLRLYLDKKTYENSKENMYE